MPVSILSRIACVSVLLVLASCAAAPKTADTQAPLILKPASFAALDGWQADDLTGFLDAYQTSCARIMKRAAGEPFFKDDPSWGTYGDWQAPCRAAGEVDESDPRSVRAFVEHHFNVMAAHAGSEREGLFTGYFESTLHGSRTRQGRYQHPLLARPKDLVMVELGDFREELKGQRIAGRVLDGRLKPYESRAEIVAGKLPPDLAVPLVWLDDPVDAFFVQVQGSGTVHLDDGGVMRVGYDGQNGHVYYAIGRELVKRGVYTKDEVSMESIRRWLEENPEEADALKNTNPSYVFFREMSPEGAQSGPQGGEGVRLTAGRSLAIDRSKMPYGFPVYVEADYKDEKGRAFRRLMMAQDTGGAIRGAVRGDVFWGAGEKAESLAGPMKARGVYYILRPKTVQ